MYNTKKLSVRKPLTSVPFTLDVKQFRWKGREGKGYDQEALQLVLIYWQVYYIVNRISVVQ